MNLYRLEYDDGSPLVDCWRGTYLGRSASMTNADARGFAQADGRDIRIVRIQGAGSMRHVRTAHPDGSISRVKG